MVRISTSPHTENDYSFVLDGQRYYTDKEFGEDKQLLTVRALRELEQERKKNAVLKKQLLKFKLKAAECADTLKNIAFSN